MKIDKKEKSFLKKIVPISAFIAGLCCFTPVILVLTGVSTVAFAASLSDLLYGTYKWAFRGAGLLFLGLALFWYFYKTEKICSFDELKKKRRKVINLTIIVLIAGVIAYVIWLYVIVELIGIVLGVWR